MSDQPVEVNFFGLKISVRNPKLAAVLNSSITDDVGVVIDRAWGDPADAEARAALGEHAA
jgi:hypothetical protein